MADGWRDQAPGAGNHVEERYDYDSGAGKDMLNHYSRALDEIYRMRVVAATTARALARVLGYATLPSGARSSVELARANLLDAARGDSEAVLVTAKSETRKANLRLAGAPETLTRGQWEIDHG